ncbi:MAG TPA: hypothetical protein VN437_00060, partial [Rectinemataceae bacterium]|nr:hypothetical protein [Rectinemataceae bacterium]
LSVRQAELAVQELSGSGNRKTGKGRAAKKDGALSSGDALEPDLLALRELLIEKFGTKVEIRGDMTHGSIAIEYYTSDDLQRILDAVGAGG